MYVIIRLQNLPWSANAADIRQYFQGLSIPMGGVIIVGGENGDAFIAFSTYEDARQAMLSNGGCIKDVKIRLFFSSRNEMQKVIETVRQQTIQITPIYMHQMQQPQLPLVGWLPTLTAKVVPQPQQQCRTNPLVTMLQRQLPIMNPTAVLMSQDKQQQFQQESQQHTSPKSTETEDRDDDGGDKRERIRSKSQEHRSKSSRSAGSNKRDRSRSRDGRRRDWSRGREEDNGDGQSSAKKRKNDEDSNVPVTCDKNPLAAEGGGGGSGGRHHNHQHHNQVPVPFVQPNIAPISSRSNCVYVHGLPTSVTCTDITQLFADTSVLPDKIHIVFSKFGRPTGESYCEFRTVQQAHMALIKDQCYMGPNLVHVSPIDRSDMIRTITKLTQQQRHHQDMFLGPGGGNGNRGGGGGPMQHYMMSGPSRQHQRPQYVGGGHIGGYGGDRPHPYVNNERGGGYTLRVRGPGPNSGPVGFGQPGCVVALHNVPYCANVQQIVDFFPGFELNSQNVIRRFDDFGKPTGEVRVNLRNPQEAMRAVRVLQNKSIFNRPVRITLL